MPEDEIELCESGFHACEDLFDCINYYNYTNTEGCKVEYHEVECSGKIIKDETDLCVDHISSARKIVCSTITIGKVVNFPFELDDDILAYDSYDKQNGFIFATTKDGGRFVFKKDGTKLFPEPLHLASRFVNGFAVINGEGENEYKRTYIGIDGKIITSIFFDTCYYFYKNGYAIVGNEVGKFPSTTVYNVIKTNGELVSNMWFDYINVLDETDYAICSIGNSYCVLDLRNGNIVNNRWYDKITYPSISSNKNDSILICVKNNFSYYIKVNGDEIVDMCFDACGRFDETGHSLAFLNSKLYRVSKDGKLEIASSIEFTECKVSPDDDDYRAIGLCCCDETICR